MFKKTLQRIPHPKQQSEGVLRNNISIVNRGLVHYQGNAKFRSILYPTLSSTFITQETLTKQPENSVRLIQEAKEIFSNQYNESNNFSQSTFETFLQARNTALEVITNDNTGNSVASIIHFYDKHQNQLGIHYALPAVIPSFAKLDVGLHFSLNFGYALQSFHSDIPWYSCQPIHSAAALHRAKQRLQLSPPGLTMLVKPENLQLTNTGLALNQFITSIHEHPDLRSFFPLSPHKDADSNIYGTITNEAHKTKAQLAIRQAHTNNVTIPLDFINLRSFLDSTNLLEKELKTHFPTMSADNFESQFLTEISQRANLFHTQQENALSNTECFNIIAQNQKLYSPLTEKLSNSEQKASKAIYLKSIEQTKEVEDWSQGKVISTVLPAKKDSAGQIHELYSEIYHINKLPRELDIKKLTSKLYEIFLESFEINAKVPEQLKNVVINHLPDLYFFIKEYLSDWKMLNPVLQLTKQSLHENLLIEVIYSKSLNHEPIGFVIHEPYLLNTINPSGEEKSYAVMRTGLGVVHPKFFSSNIIPLCIYKEQLNLLHAYPELPQLHTFVCMSPGILYKFGNNNPDFFPSLDNNLQLNPQYNNLAKLLLDLPKFGSTRIGFKIPSQETECSRQGALYIRSDIQLRNIQVDLKEIEKTINKGNQSLLLRIYELLDRKNNRQDGLHCMSVLTTDAVNKMFTSSEAEQQVSLSSMVQSRINHENNAQRTISPSYFARQLKLQPKIDLMIAKTIKDFDPSETFDWQLPTQNNIYIERNDTQSNQNLMALLQDKFSEQNASKSRIVALTGTNGCGKKQVAMRYVQNNTDKYPIRIWFNAQTSEKLDFQFQEFVKKIDPHFKSDDPTLVRNHVISWFNRQNNWLIVFYDALNHESIKNYLPQKGGDVLLTSSKVAWPNNIETIPFSLMSPEEAHALCKNITGIDSPEIDVLTKTLGYLPLALAQASAYIARMKVLMENPILHYLQEYKKNKYKMLADKTMPEGTEHEAAAITWDMSINAIAEEEQKNGENPLVKDLLKVLSNLTSDNISQAILINWWQAKKQREEKNKPDVSDGLVSIGKTIARLNDYSLITINPNTKMIGLHPLLHEVIRHQTKNVTPKSDLENLVTDLSESFFIPFKNNYYHVPDEKWSINVAEHIRETLSRNQLNHIEHLTAKRDNNHYNKEMIYAYEKLVLLYCHILKKLGLHNHSKSIFIETIKRTAQTQLKEPLEYILLKNPLCQAFLIPDEPYMLMNLHKLIDLFEKNPNDFSFEYALLVYQLGVAMYDFGETKDALEKLLLAYESFVQFHNVALNPHAINIFSYLAKAFCNQEKIAEAILMQEHAVSLAEDFEFDIRMEAHYQLRYFYLLAGELDKAEKDIVVILGMCMAGLDPEHPLLAKFLELESAIRNKRNHPEKPLVFCFEEDDIFLPMLKEHVNKTSSNDRQLKKQKTVKDLLKTNFHGALLNSLCNSAIKEQLQDLLKSHNYIEIKSFDVNTFVENRKKQINTNTKQEESPDFKFKMTPETQYDFLKTQIQAWENIESEPQIVTPGLKFLHGKQCFDKWKFIEEAQEYLENALDDLLKLSVETIKSTTIILPINPDVYSEKKIKPLHLGPLILNKYHDIVVFKEQKYKTSFFDKIINLIELVYDESLDPNLRVLYNKTYQTLIEYLPENEKMLYLKKYLEICDRKLLGHLIPVDLHVKLGEYYFGCGDKKQAFKYFTRAKTLLETYIQNPTLLIHVLNDLSPLVPASVAKTILLQALSLAENQNESILILIYLNLETAYKKSSQLDMGRKSLLEAMHIAQKIKADAGVIKQLQKRMSNYDITWDDIKDEPPASVIILPGDNSHTFNFSQGNTPHRRNYSTFFKSELPKRDVDPITEQFHFDINFLPNN